VPIGTVTYVEPGAPVTKGDFAAVVRPGVYLAAPASQGYQFGLGDFTVEAWFRTRGPGTVVGCKGVEGGRGRGGFFLVIRRDGAIRFIIDNGFVSAQAFTGPDPRVTDGRWHRLAAVRRGRLLQIFMDGQNRNARGEGALSSPIDVSNSQRLTIGRTDQQDQDRDFTGSIGAVMLWRTARTPAEVEADMRTELQGTETGLTGYWTFAYQNGADFSPTANTAVLTGAVTLETPGPPIRPGAYTASLTGGFFTAAGPPPQAPGRPTLREASGAPPPTAPPRSPCRRGQPSNTSSSTLSRLVTIPCSSTGRRASP
jgi:hypothetical protein